MPEQHMEMLRLGSAARLASRRLARLQTAHKNRCLEAFAKAVLSHSQQLAEASRADLERARQNTLFHEDGGIRILTTPMVENIARTLQNLAGQPDPVGRVEATWIRPNGLKIRKIRVPIGVLGIAYQGHPETTLFSAGLCLKSGNAGLLCSDDRWRTTNQLCAEILQRIETENDLPSDCVRIVVPKEPGGLEAFLSLDDCIDLLIPRGDMDFVRRVVQHSRIPVIRSNFGPCHIYIDREADLEMGLKIIANCRPRPDGGTGSANRILVHADIAPRFAARLEPWCQANQVPVRGDTTLCTLLAAAIPAQPADWERDEDENFLTVKVVEHLETAIGHIASHGGGNSETIVTQSHQRANAFCEAVDAAAVYVNASPRFTDAQQFGMGLEIALSTSRIHARGPMGIEELTICKYLIDGKGQVRDE